MKYFLDTEFIEGFHKPLFGKKRHHIDLISIGIVCEDGREYSAISSEYNYNDASDWVKQNVILPLYRAQEPWVKQTSDVHNFHRIVGLRNDLIAKEVQIFIEPMPSYEPGYLTSPAKAQQIIESNKPEFYGYYCDYDWVLFCSLFGTMMDLPEHYPMYCRDLKQMLDATAEFYRRGSMLLKGRNTQNVIDTIISKWDGWPGENNSHLAIEDARWNKKLHDFLVE